jgi:uncharacterized protein
MGLLTERLRLDLTRARKASDKLRVSVLGMSVSEMHNRRIETGGDLTEADEIAVISKAVKRRHEAAEQMRSAGREELAEKELEEAAILVGYLPAEADEGEVRALIRAAIDGGAVRMGEVMKQVSPKLRGRFDGRRLNALVQEALGG